MRVTSRKPRWSVLAVSLTLGVVMAVASAFAGHYGQAAFNFGLMAALGTFLGLSRSEWAVAQTDEADERQSDLNRDAMIYAYFAVVTVAVAGFLWELTTGKVGPFTFVCFVGGATHMIALAVLRRRK